MKHIQVEIAAPAGFSKALVKVNTQTHIGRYFGNVDGDPRKFRASNGLILASNVRPAKDEDFRRTNTIWLMGSGTAAQNATTIVLPREVAVKLQEAVAEYNVYYSVAEINKRVRAKRELEEAAARRAPQGNPCAVIIG